MDTPQANGNNNHRINFYLRAKTSVGGIHLPCVLEKIEGRFLKLGFNWIRFENDLTLHSIQLFAEVQTKATGAIVDYELDDETPVGAGNAVWHMPARKSGCFTNRVPLKIVQTLDPAYTPANP